MLVAITYNSTQIKETFNFAQHKKSSSSNCQAWQRRGEKYKSKGDEKGGREATLLP